MELLLPVIRPFFTNGKNISSYILREPIEDWSNYESILCEPIKVSGAKKVKMI